MELKIDKWSGVFSTRDSILLRNIAILDGSRSKNSELLVDN